MGGRADAGVIICGPEPILKLIVSGPTFRFASIIACLNDPGPPSLVLLTMMGGDCGGVVSVTRLRVQPPAMIPLLPTWSSTTYRVQVPFGVEEKTESALANGACGAGVGKKSTDPSLTSVGL